MRAHARRTTTALLATPLLLGLTACAGDAVERSGTSDATQSAGSAPAPTSTAGPVPTPEPTPAPPEPAAEPAAEPAPAVTDPAAPSFDGTVVEVRLRRR